ncbi:hypothetical protein [Corynebacterium doosanense]|uniref:Haloacid dehalogenase n=1 Tax=Corynebacterium doosanense CAU 212 = DSM 45436 TaxID=558173 RepID=A0A097ICX1_9CORY|nr:hypothetical protein [Corynebacterium doosanense]AIT59977.1 haloacid dehalogenase [Corynebacterium doosanense CAU 212 = DSM 45436]
MTTALFDLTGVLLRTPSPAALAGIEEVVGTASFWPDYADLRPQLDLGEFEERHYWDSIATRGGLAPFDTAAAVAADWAAYLEVDGAALAVAQRAQVAGHACGIVADVPTGLSTIMRTEFPWLRSFVAVVLSCDIGLPAADPRSFQVALEVMGASAKGSLYVCADPSALAAAEEAGLTAVTYTGPESVEEFL